MGAGSWRACGGGENYKNPLIATDCSSSVTIEVLQLVSFTDWEFMAMQFSDGSYTPLSASRSCIALSSCAMQSTSVKIGGLWKRSQGVSRFTKSNYKHRVFILTDQALSYYGGTVDVRFWAVWSFIKR